MMVSYSLNNCSTILEEFVKKCQQNKKNKTFYNGYGFFTTPTLFVPAITNGGGARTAISIVKQGDLKGVNKRCALFTQ